MEQIIIDIMNNFGYIGISLLIAIENLFPPIPSEVILTFGGFMTTYSNLSIVGVVISSTIGAVLGAIALYMIGRILKKERLIKVAEGKIGKRLGFKKEDIEKADNWFNKQGTKTVFFCRFIPIIRSLISIPAGVNGMNMVSFLTFTTLGTIIWNTVLTVLGSILGKNWMKIVNVIDTYAKVVAVIIVILLLILGYIYYEKRIKKEKK